MSTIVIAATPGSYVASLGAMTDAHARLGEAFATNPALGDYASMQTRLMLVSSHDRLIELAGGRQFAPDERLANIDQARIVYLPSFQAPEPEKALDLVSEAGAFHTWLRGQREAGALIAACGASILHLAVAGLLGGATCSVPIRLRPLIAARFQSVHVMESEVIAGQERLFTCARDADNAAMVLHVLGKAFSPAVAQSLTQRERPAGVSPLANDPLVVRAQLWIRDHFAQNFRIADLARDLGASHQVLIRRFRAAGEGTPKAFAQKLRVDAAAISLIETERSVAEIAQLVGYADIPSFRKVFIQSLGVSPGTWRRAMRHRS